MVCLNLNSVCGKCMCRLEMFFFSRSITFNMLYGTNNSCLNFSWFCGLAAEFDGNICKLRDCFCFEESYVTFTGKT